MNSRVILNLNFDLVLSFFISSKSLEFIPSKQFSNKFSIEVFFKIILLFKKIFLLK